MQSISKPHLLCPPDLRGIHSLSTSLTGAQPPGALGQPLTNCPPRPHATALPFVLQGAARGTTPGGTTHCSPWGTRCGPTPMSPAPTLARPPPTGTALSSWNVSSSLTSEPLQALYSPLRNPLSFDPFPTTYLPLIPVFALIPYVLGSIFHQRASSGGLTQGMFLLLTLLQPSTAQVHDRHYTHSRWKRSEWSRAGMSSIYLDEALL